MFKKKKREVPVQETVSETVNEVLDGPKGKKQNPLGGFFRNHTFAIVAAGAMLACFVIGGMVSGSKSGYLSELERYIIQYRNETAQMTASLEDEKVEIVQPDYGMDSSRRDADIEWMDNWISDAFTWSDAMDYNEKRATYVERLGASHPFVVNFMPPYEPQMQQGMNGQVTVGLELSGYISDRQTYLTAIDESTGTYSYLMVLHQTATDMSGRSKESTRPVILTYDIAIDDAGTRSVRNLIAVPGI